MKRLTQKQRTELATVLLALVGGMATVVFLVLLLRLQLSHAAIVAAAIGVAFMLAAPVQWVRTRSRIDALRALAFGFAFACGAVLGAWIAPYVVNILV